VGGGASKHGAGNNVLKIIKSFPCRAVSGFARKFEDPPKGGFFVEK